MKRNMAFLSTGSRSWLSVFKNLSPRFAYFMSNKYWHEWLKSPPSDYGFVSCRRYLQKETYRNKPSCRILDIVTPFSGWTKTRFAVVPVSQSSGRLPADCLQLHNEEEEEDEGRRCLSWWWWGGSTRILCPTFIIISTPQYRVAYKWQPIRGAEGAGRFCWHGYTEFFLYYFPIFSLFIYFRLKFPALCT